jgi:iron complex outermembrane receptor protein
VGSVKLASGVWVAGAPKDTEKLGLTYSKMGWASSVQVERIGETYNAGKASNQDFLIDPVTVTNLFVNYSFDQGLWLMKKAKIQASVNNVFNKHNIVGVASAATGSSSLTPSASDLLAVLPAVSANLTLTASF